MTKKSLNANPETESFASMVVDSAIEVHRHLGPGLIEAIYEEALCHELGLRKITFARQVPVAIDYKGSVVGQARLDLLVGNQLIVELKSVEALLPVHSAQVIGYLKMTRLELGLLLNFNKPLMKDGIRRIIIHAHPFVSSCLRGENSESHHGQ